MTGRVYPNHSCKYNTLLGYAAGTAYTTGQYVGNICLGGNVVGVAGENNVMRLGSDGTGDYQQNKCYIAGVYGRTVGATNGVVVIDNAHKLGSLSSLTVALGGTGVATLTSHGVLCGAETSAMTATAEGATGQILTGVTGANPAWSSSPSLTNITLGNGGAVRTSTVAGNTLLLQAYDVDGTAYVTFGTLTANNTPTFDLSTDVTIGTAYIYRAGGTDISVADGGTGASTLTSHGILMGNGTSAVSVSSELSNGQLLIGKTGDFAQAATITAGTNMTVTNGAGAITLSQTLTALNDQTDSYTLVLGDAGKMITMTKATANTLTIPKNSSVAFPVGTFVLIYQGGAGQTTISPVDGDVTLRATDSLVKLYGIYSVGAIVKLATDTWVLFGDLS